MNIISAMFQFCGKVTLDWNKGKGDVNRCFKEASREYCFCEQNIKYLCNTGTLSLTMNISLGLLSAALTLLWL